MTTWEQLHPWCIIRHREKAQNVVVGRFRRRSDAINHASILRQLTPQVDYEVVYFPPTVLQPEQS
ncbi:MAG: hypothetical protein F6K03_07770 [Kamptonema sp. SIO4C4]|nr:hypothetical protein [Kamptonema sp. SIO4C4]